MNPIFNRSLLAKHRNKVAELIEDYNFLIKLSSDQIFEHVLSLRPSYSKILDLGARNGFLTQKLMNNYKDSYIEATDVSFKMLELNPAKYKQILDEENMPEGLSFDLITSVLNAHWINDLPKFFRSLKRSLNEGGFLVISFFVAPSLNNLRSCLLQAEIATSSISSPHISPFVTASDVYKLLQYAGFKFIIVENDNIELEYNNPIALMRELKNMGESNKLLAAHPLLPRSVFKKLKATTGTFIDSVEIATIIAS